MVEPTMPIGITIAAFVMTIVSWYGMVRNGIQLVHNDLEARKSVDADIQDMYNDLISQDDDLNRWKKNWYITKHTPDAVLLQYWGTQPLHMIKEKLNRIKEDLDKARKALDGVSGSKQDDSYIKGKFKKRLRKVLYIGIKKQPVQDLINRYSGNMTIIKQESKAGWDDQQQILSRQIGPVTPYHIQIAYLLVRIAMQIQTDAEALRISCQKVEHDIAVLLDLDIFDSSASRTQYQNVERIAQILEAGHLKLELLLREADRHQEELTRVVVERALDGVPTESRDIDAFRTILGATGGNPYLGHFNFNASRPFRMSKIPRTRNPCSRLQQTFQEALADHDEPIYDANTQQLLVHEAVLGKVSNSRAAFELAQVCLLFLRNSWIAEICRCRLRCELPDTPDLPLYHFGLEMARTTHQPPKWRDPHNPGVSIEGNSDHLWCTGRISNWNRLNKPMRYLGLFLVELALGTVVFPVVDSPTEEAAMVTNVHVLNIVNADSSSWEWKTISLKIVLELVKRSFNDSDQIARAVEHCLIGSFPPAPSDAEWETQLRIFYFRVVRPLMDLYEIRLTSGV